MTEHDEALGRDSADTPQNRPPTGDPRLARLREHERLWMLWVSLLHDHHSKMGTEESRIVLDIATRRWAAAKSAVDTYQPDS